MPYIPLDEKLPGITGILNYRLDTALPIRQLTQILLRGESSLTEGERELIATVVSHGNECRFCTAAHTAAANVLIGDTETSEKVKTDLAHAPVSPKMKALLTIAKAAGINGRNVTPAMVDEAKKQGASDRELYDTIAITSLFSLYNRLVDGLASVTPAEPAFYDRLAGILKDKGYLPSEDRYAGLTK